jgi:hypothetical protein
MIPVLISHILIVLSRLELIILSSLQKHKALTKLIWQTNVLIISPLVAFHNFIVLSSLPLNIKLFFG